MPVGIPFWMVTRRAVSVPLASSAVANLASTSARSAGLDRDQPIGSSKARRAAATAVSTSTSVASGTLPTSSSVVAEWTLMRASDAGAVQSPSR
jgi:hypothetical protein